MIYRIFRFKKKPAQISFEQAFFDCGQIFVLIKSCCNYVI